MGWESRKGRGRYYIRNHRVGRRFVREYLGTGARAERAAAEDAARRQQRQAEAAAWLAEQSGIQNAESPTFDLATAARSLTHAQLLQGGYHQHAHGHWRRRSRRA